MHIPSNVRKAVVPYIDLKKATAFLKGHGVTIVPLDTGKVRLDRSRIKDYGVVRVRRNDRGEAITIEQHLPPHRSYASAVRAALTLEV